MRRIAGELGVSVMTVSKVLNNHGDISEATRGRVLAKIEELGYQRNAVARSLTLRRSHTIGVVIPETDLETVFGSLLRRPGFPEPERQVWVDTAAGPYRMDFAYKRYRFGMEPMGGEFHAGRWEADMRRLAALAAVDWQVLPVSDFDVRHREHIVLDGIKAALIRAGHQFN